MIYTTNSSGRPVAITTQLQELYLSGNEAAERYVEGLLS